MKQFVAASEPDKNGRLKIGGKEFHYLVHVRRVKLGESLNIVLPSGENACANVCALSGDCVELILSGKKEEKSEALPKTILFQALPKDVKMDLIVRQATECGVSQIVPFKGERSIERSKTEPRLERWRRIVKEARQQSGSNSETLVFAPVAFNEIFSLWNKIQADALEAGGVTAGVFLHTQGDCVPFHFAFNGVINAAALAVGPEGGFSAAEAEIFSKEGFLPVSLGQNVLRTESAALAGLAVLRILLLERSSWKNTVNG
ncbi:MAG: 16S rRNA (uracil(1498)-N(3))-methyltransferase [Termitinemataceae bacterium]|nr:MAG: 16S rRNA (uracil(1498)-N(3))-methyltransferase [Termitinemataceae bacterium]